MENKLRCLTGPQPNVLLARDLCEIFEERRSDRNIKKYIQAVTNIETRIEEDTSAKQHYRRLAKVKAGNVDRSIIY